MYWKAICFNDKSIAVQILSATEPRRVKALGRQVKGFRDDRWDEVKYKVVVEGNWYKFTQNPTFKQRLLETGNKIIVEASPYDKIWGIGVAATEDKSKWRGQNLLGKAIMEVRDKNTYTDSQ